MKRACDSFERRWMLVMLASCLDLQGGHEGSMRILADTFDADVSAYYWFALGWRGGARNPQVTDTEARRRRTRNRKRAERRRRAAA